MKMKKVLATLLTLCMVLGLLPAAAFAAETPVTVAPISATDTAKTFPDTAGHWAESAIVRWAGYGIVKGDEAGKFNPDADISRAALATILADFLKLSAKSANAYTDVPADAWFADAVLKCTAAGIMKGSDGLAKPDDCVTRQEAMVMLARALGVAPATADLTIFTDGATVADWAAGYVTAMTKRGIVAGVGGNTVAPLAHMNRASVLSILDKAVSDYIAVAGTYSKVVGTGIVAVVAPDVVLKGNKIAGSLLVAEGVGDGNFTLDGTNVAGTTTVRGGGVNSFVVKGGSKLGAVTISRVDGAVRVVTSDGSTIETTFIDDGKDDVIMEGKFGDVVVDGNVPVTLKGADVKNVTATGKNADITVDKTSKVDTVATKGEGTKITVAGTVNNVAASAEATGVNLTVAKGGNAKSVVTAAAGSVINNDGKVGDVSMAKGADTKYVAGEGTALPKFTATDKKDLTATTAAAEKAAAEKAAAEKLAAEAKTDAEKKAAEEAKAAADKAAAAAKKDEDKIKTDADKGTVEKPVTPPVVADPAKPEEKPVDPKPTASAKPSEKPNPGGGGDEPVVNYANIKAAPLIDQRQNASPTPAAGSFVPAGNIIKGYTATGIVASDNASKKIVNVAFTGTHLMKHAAGNNVQGFWVGIAVPKVTGETYAYARGACPEDISTFDKSADGTYTEGGVEYNSFYFDAANANKIAYLAVKSAAPSAKITVYNLDFSHVTMADPIENAKLYLVTDKASFDRLPENFKMANPWDTKRDEATVIADTDFPWLVVTYDRNVVGTVTFASTRNGAEVGGMKEKTMEATTIGTDRYSSWAITQFTNSKPTTSTSYLYTEAEGKKYGDFSFSIAADEKPAVKTNTVTCVPTNAALITFKVDGNTVQSFKQETGATMEAPVTPTKTGYTFAKWVKEGTATDMDATVPAVAAVYEATWTANTYTIKYDGNGNTAGTKPADATPKYDADVTLAAVGDLVKTGYTFNGWNTAANGSGTSYAAGATVKNLAASGAVTLYAQWTLNDALTLAPAGSATGITATTTAATTAGTVTTYKVTLSGTVAASSTGSGEPLQYTAVDGMLAVAGQKHTFVTLKGLIPASANTTIVQTNPALMYYTTDSGNDSVIALTEGDWVKTKEYDKSAVQTKSDYSLLLLAGQNVTLKVGANAIYEITNSVTITSAPTATSYTPDKNLTIKTGATFTVAEGKTLTIGSGKILTNNGIVTNKGTITNAGTITNNGTGTVSIATTGTMTNTGTFTNVGNIEDTGTLTNSGTITSTAGIILVADDGQLSIKSGGTVTVNAFDTDGTKATGELLSKAAYTLETGKGAVQVEAGGTLTAGTFVFGAEGLNMTTGYAVVQTYRNAVNINAVRLVGNATMNADITLGTGAASTITQLGVREGSTLTIPASKTLTCGKDAGASLYVDGTVIVNGGLALAADAAGEGWHVAKTGAHTITLAEGAKVTVGKWHSFVDGTITLTTETIITVGAADAAKAVTGLSAGDYVGNATHPVNGFCLFTKAAPSP